MLDPRLPELPEPQWCMPERMAGQWKIPGAWSSDQMHAYGLAVWKAAIEAAAAQLPDTWLDPLLTGKGGIGQPPYSCTDIEKLLTNLRAAIRSLPDPSATPQDQGGER